MEPTKNEGVINECLFCRSTTNNFSSVEHIFPESLGNKEKLLPKGVVCDKCNNGKLSELDAHLLDFEPVSFFLTFNGIRSKKGKIPRAALGNMILENHTGSDVKINLDSLSKKHYEPTPKGFRLHIKGKRKWDDRYLKLIVRALYKITLELIYLDHGSDFALSKRYNKIREIVLGEKDFGGYLMIGTNKNSVDPKMTYRFLKDEETDVEFTIFEFNFMFLKIISDLERRKTLPNSGSKVLDMTLLKFEIKS